MTGFRFVSIWFVAVATVAPLAAQILPHRPTDPIPAQIESMYERGLNYLLRTQNSDGYWNDPMGGEPAVVGLCIKAFLAHGDDPVHGPYAEAIRKGIDYILSNQKERNGYIGNSMYNHGFATLALAEAYGMVGHPDLAEALESAVQLILTAQARNPANAWRYSPESRDADTTVSGCQLVALLGARNAGIGVPEEAIRKGLAFMARCRDEDGSYGYTSAGGGKPTLTAIGVTCLGLAKERTGKGFEKSVSYLAEHLDYRDQHYPYYYEYYMSQALHQASDELWTTWNDKNVRYLAVLQRTDGSWPGDKGEAFSTAGALLSLAINYRYLPIYEK